MEGRETWEWVIRQARRTLRCYSDRETNEERDDIVQDACVLVWEWADNLSDIERLGSAVHTIVKRQRSRSVRASKKRRSIKLVDFGEPAAMHPPAPATPDSNLSIAGKPVPLGWAKGRLQRVMQALPPLDRQLLLGFHEGFCCAELASRFGRSEGCVKTRISRARRRVRTVFEDLVRMSGNLEESESEEN
ncbi:MAG: DNA-directed RNA polymerase specialized sigma24 family protein [Planctomycetota bacterium]|jgi:DNA-directed RNA polymerase specialized sigma24 family protein